MFTAVHKMPMRLAPKTDAGSFRSHIVRQAVQPWTKRKTGVATG